MRGVGEEVHRRATDEGAERVVRKERATEKKTKVNRYPHNQWQVGNFLTQKLVKAGGPGAF